MCSFLWRFTFFLHDCQSLQHTSTWCPKSCHARHIICLGSPRYPTGREGRPSGQRFVTGVTICPFLMDFWISSLITLAFCSLITGERESMLDDRYYFFSVLLSDDSNVINIYTFIFRNKSKKLVNVWESVCSLQYQDSNVRLAASSKLSFQFYSTKQ